MFFNPQYSRVISKHGITTQNTALFCINSLKLKFVRKLSSCSYPLGKSSGATNQCEGLEFVQLQLQAHYMSSWRCALTCAYSLHCNKATEHSSPVSSREDHLLTYILNTLGPSTKMVVNSFIIMFIIIQLTQLRC